MKKTTVKKWIDYLNSLYTRWPTDWIADEVMIYVNNQRVNSQWDFIASHFEETYKDNAIVTIGYGYIYTDDYSILTLIRSLEEDFELWENGNVHRS